MRVRCTGAEKVWVPDGQPRLDDVIQGELRAASSPENRAHRNDATVRRQHDTGVLPRSNEAEEQQEQELRGGA
eukprot:4674633-Alexandrium_andersonii.AAC.1